MIRPRATSPVTIFFLVLPYGISGGFASVTLPFVLTRAGFPVAVAASIVAIGISSNLWRFLWGPVADLTLTPRRWYLLGLAAAAATLLLLSRMPMRPNAAFALTVMVFISQVAATLGGIGLGGGAGVWLATHRSIPIAGAALAAMMAACALSLLFVPDVGRPLEGSVGRRLREIGSDFRDLLRSPMAVLAIVLVSSPVGSGAAVNLWSAVAPDWRATPDTVALVTGILGGIVSAVGSVIGGWIADRRGRWWSYLGSGVFMGAIASAMALAPRTPAAYVAGVVLYALSCGMVYAAFSALLLHVIGRGAASTKYATLSSLGNLPTAYMTAFDGWAHDRWGAGGMLHAEALLGVGSTALILVALGRIRAGTAGRKEMA